MPPLTDREPLDDREPQDDRGPRAEVDWDALRSKAIAAMRRAYTPYSNFPVGVAGLVDDGRVVSGCNVENAAYGVTLCAECGMVSQLHLSGGGRLVAVSCVNAEAEPLMPCGRCRQLLWEHGGPDCLLMTARGIRSMREVLPDAFGADDLDHHHASVSRTAGQPADPQSDRSAASRVPSTP